MAIVCDYLPRGFFCLFFVFVKLESNDFCFFVVVQVVVTFLRFAPGMDQRPLRFVWLVDYPYGARRYFQDDVRRRCTFSREHKAWIQDLLKESDSSHLLQLAASLRAHSFQVRGLAEVQVGKEHNDFCIWDREETAMHSYHCFQHDVCCLQVENGIRVLKVRR